MLKTLALHLLLLGVVFGLVGQSAALASTPHAATAKAQAAGAMADMPDCPKMRDADKGKVPCKDMSPGSFAMAGCSAVIAIDAQPELVASPTPLLFAATWPATPVLTGRDIAPDPDPPSLLG